MSSPSPSHTPDGQRSPTDSNDGEDLGPPQTATFLRHVSAKSRDYLRVAEEHVYSRPWGWRADDWNAQQARLLLMNPPATSRHLCSPMIDVETVDEPANLTDTDERASLVAMDECADHVATGRDVPDNLIHHLDQRAWSAPQRKLLSRVMAALDAHLLARRALVGRRGAAFTARVAADRCSARVRRALAAAGWARPLCQWLHSLLLQKLGRDALALYLEVLQTLNSKVPSLVERLTSAGVARHGMLSSDSLAVLLRRPWDPAAHLIGQHRLRRLPNSPLLVLVPSSPCQGSRSSQLGRGATRLDFWHRQLSNLAKVAPISVFEGGAPSHGISVSESLSHILAMCRQQLSELRRPGRPIVLLGWGAGGLVASHLALVEPVSAVVGLGFPFWSAAGRRGVPDDPLLESLTPTLLVVGELAADASPQELEVMRDAMKAETALVVVGGADRRLLVNAGKRQREGLTQGMVDRAIIEEISDFLTRILTQQLEGSRPVFPRLPTPPLHRPEDAMLKNLARERRRKPNGHAASRPRLQKQANATAGWTDSRPAKVPRLPPTPPEPAPCSATSSLSDTPIIDLIRVGDGTESPEPEPPAPAPLTVPAMAAPLSDKSPAGPSPLKMITTPPLRPKPAPTADATMFAGGLSVGVAQRRGTSTRGGRLKITQKLEPGVRPKRGRGQSRAAKYGMAGFTRPGPFRFGVSNELVWSTSHIGPSRFLAAASSASASVSMPAAAAAAAVTTRQLVYVRPPTAGVMRRAPSPTAVARAQHIPPLAGAAAAVAVPAGERLLVVPTGRHLIPGRQLLVSRAGISRTVTYVPTSKVGQQPARRTPAPGQHLVPRPAGHEYAADTLPPPPQSEATHASPARAEPADSPVSGTEAETGDPPRAPPVDQ